MIDARTGNKYLDQYLANITPESKEGAAQVYRAHYGHIAYTHRAVCVLRGDMIYARAIEDIMESAPENLNHPVVDCSEGKSHLVGEKLK